MRARDRELDTFYQKVYEDEASGKISTERFSKLARGYEQEQAELAGKIATLAAELEDVTDKTVTANMFLSTVRQYTRAKKLTPRIRLTAFGFSGLPFTTIAWARLRFPMSCCCLYLM